MYQWHSSVLVIVECIAVLSPEYRAFWGEKFGSHNSHIEGRNDNFIFGLGVCSFPLAAPLPLTDSRLNGWMMGWNVSTLRDVINGTAAGGAIEKRADWDG